MIKENNSKQADKNKVVQLSQLINEPQCLKLLILHTPFTIKIDCLHLCTNLVKIDLSRNKINRFPYLGSLTNLKFIFIHENELQIEDLIGIFQQDDQKSYLSSSVIWITYWGNKNQFLGRHYLATSTSALAIDLNMVSLQQKNATLSQNPLSAISPFSENSNIADIFDKRKKFGKNATEQEYMKDFWGDVAALRKKWEKMMPVVKIQKIFRGWRVRKYRKDKQQAQLQKTNILKAYFKGWKKQIKNEKKLTVILNNRNKSYLLLPLKQMKLYLLKQKLLSFARQAKIKYRLRLSFLVPQRRFYQYLKKNRNMMRQLYKLLHLSDSSKIYLLDENKQTFDNYITKYLKNLHPNNQQIKLRENSQVYLRWMGSDLAVKKQSLKLMKNNNECMTDLTIQNKLVQKDKTLNILVCSQRLKPLYSKNNIYFSIKDKKKIKKHLQNFTFQDSVVYRQILVIQQKQQLMKDIIRGIYYYNSGYLTGNKVPEKRIHILTQYFVKKSASIIKIQKNWRGYIYRKKNKQLIKKNYTQRRAAVIIQRWFRSLPSKHRQSFINEKLWYLKKFNTDKFYIRLNDYFLALRMCKLKDNDTYPRISFPEQCIRPYNNKQTKKMVLFWKNKKQGQGYERPECRKKFFYQTFRKQLFGAEIAERFQDISKYISPKMKQLKNKQTIQHGSNSERQNNLQKMKQIYSQSQTDNQFYSKFQELQISHLFHYQTNVTIYNRIGGISHQKLSLGNQTDKDIVQYLQIRCNSKYECRMRVLAIFLMCYEYQKNSIFRKTDFILPVEFEVKQGLDKASINKKIKTPVENNNAIFISQRQSNFQVQVYKIAQNIKEVYVPVKFYLKEANNLEFSKCLNTNNKPLKMETQLHLVILENKTQKSSGTKKIKYQENKNHYHIHTDNDFRQIQIDRFLITQNSLENPSQQDLSNNFNENKPPKSLYHHSDFAIDLPNPTINAMKRLEYVVKNNKKKQLVNLKADRLYKLKKKRQLRELKDLERQQVYQYNYMINNGRSIQSIQKQQSLSYIVKSKNDRLNTQPDIPTLSQQQNFGYLSSEHKYNIKSAQSIHSQITQNNIKSRAKKRKQNRLFQRKAESFAMNFMNHNNFIQKQVLSSHIKRIRTEQSYQSMEKYKKIKTEHSLQKKQIEKYNEEKKKFISEKKQVHRDLLAKNCLDKRKNAEDHLKIMNDRKAENLNRKYNSHGKKIKVTFAEQCYPIINKKK